VNAVQAVQDACAMIGLGSANVLANRMACESGGLCSYSSGFSPADKECASYQITVKIHHKCDGRCDKHQLSDIVYNYVGCFLDNIHTI
jgi:hypothetical protein